MFHIALKYQKIETNQFHPKTKTLFPQNKTHLKDLTWVGPETAGPWLRHPIGSEHKYAQDKKEGDASASLPTNHPLYRNMVRNNCFLKIGDRCSLAPVPQDINRDISSTQEALETDNTCI